ncbi:BON domain-containing protein [Comamonadaceae bacterium OH2545_COT-014]|nr:BON domain-containing protein [Comamonadaceae bacterium OH2545_COT-014]
MKPFFLPSRPVHDLDARRRPQPSRPLSAAARRVAGAAMLAALAGAGLSACVPLVVGGTAAVSTMVVTDRRSSSMQLTDQGIELRAGNRAADALQGRGHINIVSYYRKVLLTGEVPTEDDRQRVQAAVQQTENVLGVVNELAVMPNSSLSQRSHDTLVTGRVKANLLDANGVPSNSIKVVTERGTTYLMGRLTEREALLATEVARRTNGVQRVVRVIDPISPEEALHPGAGAPASQPPAPAMPGQVPVGTPVGVPVGGAPVTGGVSTQPITPSALEPVQVTPVR